MATDSRTIASRMLPLLIGMLSLSACGGGGGDSSSMGLGNTPSSPDDDGLISDSGMDDEPEASGLFPPPGPVIDPASSPEEIASRTDLLLVEHRMLMIEVFRQMDEVYRTIGSGLPTSEDQSLVEADARFYEAINTNCDPEFDNTGTMIALRNCNYTPATFELRHPVYSGTRVLVSEYALGVAFEEGADTDVSIYGAGYSERLDENESVRFDTGLARLSLDDEQNPPSVRVEAPAYFGAFGKSCSTFLSPTRFPDDDLRVNECSELLRDALTVLQRLNDR